MNKQLFAELQPHGAVLPSIVFFEPLPCFADYLNQLEPQPKVIIDVGAGMGRMSRILTEAGFKCLAIDICERDSTEHEILPLDALSFIYPETSLPIMARPCHGHWIEFAIDQAMRTVPMMLYVGLKKNLADDLYGMSKKYKVTREKMIVGEDGEIIVRIEKK